MFVGTAMLWSDFSLEVKHLSRKCSDKYPKIEDGITEQAISFWFYVGGFKPTKMEMEVSCLFCVSEVSCLICVSEVMTALVTSYYGRQSIAKLIAQPYFTTIDWLLIALSVWNVLMFLKLVELIHHEFKKQILKFPLEHFRQNS